MGSSILNSCPSFRFSRVLGVLTLFIAISSVLGVFAYFDDTQIHSREVYYFRECGGCDGSGLRVLSRTSRRVDGSYDDITNEEINAFMCCRESWLLLPTRRQVIHVSGQGDRSWISFYVLYSVSSRWWLSSSSKVLALPADYLRDSLQRYREQLI